MELRQLETFVTVAEERSFSRAAQRLHVVQSAVSATIKTLERELAVSVFERTAHRVELTDAGRALLPRRAERWRRPAPRGTPSTSSGAACGGSCASG